MWAFSCQPNEAGSPAAITESPCPARWPDLGNSIINDLNGTPGHQRKQPAKGAWKNFLVRRVPLYRQAIAGLGASDGRRVKRSGCFRRREQRRIARETTGERYRQGDTPSGGIGRGRSLLEQGLVTFIVMNSGGAKIGCHQCPRRVVSPPTPSISEALSYYHR